MMKALLLMVAMATSDAATLPCRLEPVVGDANRYTMTLWGRPVIRKCPQGVFVKETCRCIQDSGKVDDLKPENIIGGSQIHIKDAPWTIQIDQITTPNTPYREIVCGGALLASRWAVTARHCVDETYVQGINGHNSSVTKQRVRAGVSLRRDREIPTATSSFKIFIDPATKDIKGRGKNKKIGVDFALLHLDTPILEHGEYIQYIDIATDYKSYRQHHCTFSGMGFTKAGTHIGGPSQLSPYLKKTYLLPLRKGDNRCWVIIDELHGMQGHPICAIDPAVGPCKRYYADASNATVALSRGDSGGPLVCKDPSGKNVLLGLDSRGTGKCFPGSPTVFTNVVTMRKYIKATMDANP